MPKYRVTQARGKVRGYKARGKKKKRKDERNGFDLKVLL
jgi:hypothetical protein